MKLPFKKRKKYKLVPAQKAKGILRDHPGFVRGDISHKTGSLKRVSRVTPESLPALSSGTPDSQIPLRPQSTVRRQIPKGQVHPNGSYGKELELWDAMLNSRLLPVSEVRPLALFT